MTQPIKLIDGTGEIVPFYGTSFVFSNFHPAKFTANGVDFNCSEQYFMYQKASYVFID